jgi:hypothetical protein
MRFGPTGSICFLLLFFFLFFRIRDATTASEGRRRKASERNSARGRGPALVYLVSPGRRLDRRHSYGAVARWSLRSCVAVPPPPPPHVLAALLVDGGPALAGLTQPKSPARSVPFVTLRIGVLKLQASGSATGDDGVGLHGIGRN